ncbi:twin-arginine translocase subunit TatC [Paenibacillus sp. TAB 01]|uniref:twin-arginine translocase subunit TatC n=1 Tax=Paenibacillus sp. TAB 01 TaxID=3368988 RepID=UPI003751DE15
MENQEWVEHLTELRKRLMIVAGWFVVTFGGGLYIAPSLLLFIKSQPTAAGIQWNVFSFTDGLFIYMKCAVVLAVLFTLPVLFYHLWAFARPGLTEQEASSTLLYLPASFVLFLTGLCFSYFVVFPMMVHFMMRMNKSIGAVETYGIDKYFSFLFDVVFPLSAAFELPVVLLFLTKIGLVTPDTLRKARKHAYVGLAIIGSCLSPPDFFSHLSVTVPLILLFEISIIVSGWQYRAMKQPLPNS